MNYKDNDKYFCTSNFYLAVFLYTKELQLIDIDRSNPQRSQFVFVDSQARQQLVRGYSFSEKNTLEVMVDAREFSMAIKTLKNKLYQEANI